MTFPQLEEWRDLPYESNYHILSWQISSYGRVKMIKKSGQIRYTFGSTGRYGYKHKRITSRDMKVHRLVATAFLPNPNNEPCIDHIDRQKANNHVSNLRWISYSDNNRNRAPYGKGYISTYRKKHKSKTYQYWSCIVYDEEGVKVSTHHKTLEDAQSSLDQWRTENDVV